MRMMNRLVIVGALLLMAVSAQAQVNPELGDVGGSAGGEASAGAGAQGQASWTPPPAPPPAAPAAVPPMGAAPGGSDHSGVVGAMGIGFFGVMNLPVMACLDGPACTMPEVEPAIALGAESVSAPTIGARYWLDEAFGVEAGLGLAITSEDFETTGGPGGATPIRVTPSILGLALHGGVPLVLAHSGHFAFQAVPFLNVGIVSGTLTPAMGPETSVSGFLLELGGRVGAEIHFGFIDIPQLSLQGNVGLSLRMESRSAEQDGSPTKVEWSRTAISTGVGDDPWDIFAGSISAIYYFGG